MMLKESQRFRENDLASDDEKKSFEKYVPQQRQNWVRLMLNASRKTQEPAVAQSLKAEIEGGLPSEKEQQSAYWWNRAALAAAESRKADALTFYQSALLARTQEVRYVQGRRKDELGDEAHALFSELGGTETAWAVWSQRPQAAKQELTEGRWEAPKKELPRFDLKDMEGKTWRLHDLGGKSVLINLWATWCGPCKAELPKLQQLYNQTKDRKDFQILSFNIDGEVGLVEPYLKEHGYSFPVVPAYDFVNAFLDRIGIPQNWIVDPAGKWRWTQLGFDSSEPNWTEAMLKRMESVQAQR
jgi:thiol-disulfide isomerase/thioredoxin